MKLLVLAHDFPPMGGGGVLRTVKYVKYLSRLGWDVAVVSVDERWYARSYLDPTLLAELPANAQIFRVPVLKPQGQAREAARHTRSSSPGFSVQVARFAYMAQQCLDHFSVFMDVAYLWLPFALPIAMKLLREDGSWVIYTSFPSAANLVAGLVLNRLTGVPWAVDFRDAWFGNPFFTSRSQARNRLERWLEGEVVRQADIIISATSATTNDLMTRYPDLSDNRFHTIPNGFDPDDYNGISQIELPGGSREHLCIVHAGPFNSRRNPSRLFAAMRQLCEEDSRWSQRIRLIVLGPPSPFTEIAQSDPLLRHVVRHPGQVPHREALSFMRSADVNLLMIHEEEDAKAIPSKTYEYLGAGKPILAAVCDGAVADLLIAVGGALIVHPKDTNGLAEAIRDLWKARMNGRPLAPPINEHVRNEFSRVSQAGQLSKYLRQILMAQASGHLDQRRS